LAGFGEIVSFVYFLYYVFCIVVNFFDVMRCLFSSCISCGVIVVPSVLVVISSSVQFVFCVELVEIVGESYVRVRPINR
jgi:hypothetical protein